MSASISYSYMPGRALRIASRCASHAIAIASRMCASSAGSLRSRISCRRSPGARLHLLRAADEGHEPVRERVVPPDRVPDLRRLLEEARQLPLEILELEGGVRPGALDGALDAGARAHPELALGVARADEEDEALLQVGREHAHRLRLGEAGHVREVAVLPVGVEDVGRARPLGRGGE